VRPTRAEIDLDAIAHNVRQIGRALGNGVGICGVVKADGYGHGALQVARAVESAGGAALAVSLVEEGVELRRGGVTAPILVMGGVYGHAHAEVLAQDLTPVVFDLADVEAFARAARRWPAGRVGVHLKIDTGMARLGVRPERLAPFVDGLLRFPEVEVVGLMTHLASADHTDPAPTRTQLALFETIRTELAARGVQPRVTHAANSAAAVRFPEARYGFVRPGLLLYGGAPSDEARLEGLRPAMRFVTHVAAVRDVPAGTAVSYGGRFVTSRTSRLATLPAGYADGYPRHLGGAGAEVLVRGHRVPVAGAICMDMIIVDVTDVPEVAVGDEVVLLGEQGSERVTAEELATRAGTIPWEILCGVSKRVPRTYVGSGE
jgi:alanine racemase